MDLEDTLHFDSMEYASAISTISDNELYAIEIVMRRQTVRQPCTAIIGAVKSCVTLGVSAVVSLVAICKYDVAEKKLKLIEQEVKNRGLEQQRFRKRDIFIPAAKSITIGVVVGIEELEAINELRGCV